MFPKSFSEISAVVVSDRPEWVVAWLMYYSRFNFGEYVVVLDMVTKSLVLERIGEFLNARIVCSDSNADLMNLRKDGIKLGSKEFVFIADDDVFVINFPSFESLLKYNFVGARCMDFENKCGWGDYDKLDIEIVKTLPLGFYWGVPTSDCISMRSSAALLVKRDAFENLDFIMWDKKCYGEDIDPMCEALIKVNDVVFFPKCFFSVHLVGGREWNMPKVKMVDDAPVILGNKVYGNLDKASVSFLEELNVRVK